MFGGDELAADAARSGGARFQSHRARHRRRIPELMEGVVEPRLGARIWRFPTSIWRADRRARSRLRSIRAASRLWVWPAAGSRGPVIAARDVSAGFANVGQHHSRQDAGREPVVDLGPISSSARPAACARCRRRAHRARQGALGLLPQRRARVYITLRAHFRVEHRRADRRREGSRKLNAARLREPVDRAVLRRACTCARDRVRQESLAIGILLAVGGLWYFLRGPRALLVIGLSIPLSLFFAVITLHLLGRTLNVVSLAGLAFSTGIVIDAALIAQGNVLRYVQRRAPADEGYARGHRRGHAGAARLDADQRRDFPADPVHGGSRRAALQGPRNHHVGVARGVAAGRDDADPGGQPLGACARHSGGPAPALVDRDDRSSRCGSPTRRGHAGAGSAD